jgi:hypothetical protein
MVEESKEREQKENTGSEEEEGEERSGKRVVGPRKKFRWNQEIRCLFMFYMSTHHSINTHIG